MADVAPPELGKLLRNVFYKHSAPLALQNLGSRQQYLHCFRAIKPQRRSWNIFLSTFSVAAVALWQSRFDYPRNPRNLDGKRSMLTNTSLASASGRPSQRASVLPY